jgi:dUTPase
MSLLKYYQYLGKNEITLVDPNTIKTLSNPGAICTVERHIVINLLNTTFTLEQVKEIVEFVIKKIEKDENKSSD